MDVAERAAATGDGASPCPVRFGRGPTSPTGALVLVRVGAAGVGALGVAAAVDAARRVRAMRARAALVAPLEHDLDLPGRAPTRRLVVLGDSAAAGHGLPTPDEGLARRLGRALVAGDGRATEVRSFAVDGATTAEVLADQLEGAGGAELVVVGVGVNDAVRPGAVAGVTADLRRLLAGVRARARPGARVVLLTCPDLSAAPGMPGVLRPVLGRRCRALARAQAEVAAEMGVAVVGVDRAMLVPEVFGGDGFHPGAVGHERLVERILEVLAAPLHRPPPPPAPAPTGPRPGGAVTVGRTCGRWRGVCGLWMGAIRAAGGR